MRPRLTTTRKDVIGCAQVAAGVALGLLACLVITLCSCRAQVERVEVPVVVTQEHTVESVRIDHVRDTVTQRDSVFYYIKGDTTIIERWHTLQGKTVALRVDTLRMVDSIPYPVTTERVRTVEVVKPLHWWQRALIGLGCFALMAGALWVAWKVRKK